MKLNIAVLFGGRSTEHKVSIRSAINVVSHLDREKYIIHLIGIDPKGVWRYHGQEMEVKNQDNAKTIELTKEGNEVFLSQNADEHYLNAAFTGEILAKIDVLYPVLHGLHGEDGSVQGLAKLANLPCVGPGIAGSAVGMDKELMKRILRDNGLQIANFITLRKGQIKPLPTFEEAIKELGTPLFVKPANLGSSVGISKVSTKEEYKDALLLGFSYDEKLIVEEAIQGRELECAVKGISPLMASAIGEVKVTSHFYDYETKYLNDAHVETLIPAQLEKHQEERIRETALLVCEYLECYGMTRVDVFLSEEDNIIINEVNTLPGFTNQSMYPLLWKEVGVSYEQLLDDLISYAIEKHKKQNGLKLEMI